MFLPTNQRFGWQNVLALALWGIIGLGGSVSDANPSLPPALPTRWEGTPEETQNIAVYEQNIQSVVNINSGKNQGAGVILTASGLVVTSTHVIEGNSRALAIRTAAHLEYPVRLVAVGQINRDLAFLQIESQQPFVPVRLGDSATVRVGQRVLAIGSPFGLDGTLTSGIISRLDRQRNLLQTDAAINPGNSGGALLNIHGELIGINRSIINPMGASNAGVSFAVPVNVLRQELKRLGFTEETMAQHIPHQLSPSQGMPSVKNSLQ
jgi:serine protease Do